MRHMNGRVGSYAYSTIVGRFLHLQVGMVSLPISRREIDGYKVPLPIHYKFSPSALNYGKYPTHPIC
jgi:hypothetical protein